jgi:hypothetical protein
VEVHVFVYVCALSLTQKCNLLFPTIVVVGGVAAIHMSDDSNSVGLPSRIRVDEVRLEVASTDTVLPTPPQNVATNTSESLQWDESTEHMVADWVSALQVNYHMNELAAQYYSKWHKFGLALVSILTVIVGTNGLGGFIRDPITPWAVISNACNLMLAVTASLMANLDLKNNAERFVKRRNSYLHLASMLEAQLHLTRTARLPVEVLVHKMPKRMHEIEQLAEPLPHKYWKQGQKLRLVIEDAQRRHATNSEAFQSHAPTKALSSNHVGHGNLVSQTGTDYCDDRSA